MDTVFDACVQLLLWLAALTGATYKQINVIIFCVLWPALTAYQTYRIIQLRRAVNRNHPWPRNEGAPGSGRTPRRRLTRSWFDILD